jgi:hypothetical protein
MKLVLLFLFVLLGLTAIRYRKGIMSVIRFSQMVRQSSLRGVPADVQKVKKEEPSPLVKCLQCGVWVPEGRARKASGSFFCSAECEKENGK